MKLDDHVLAAQNEGPSRRRRLPSCDARRAILDAAEFLYARHGCHAVTVDSIAKQAGLHKMAIYRTFGSREALTRACIERSHEQRRARWLAVVQREYEDPCERIVVLFGELSRGAAFHPDCQSATAGKPIGGVDVTREDFREYREDVRVLLRGLVSGLLVPDPDSLVDALMLIWQGVTMDRRSLDEQRRITMLLPSLVRQVVRIFESGCIHGP